MTLLQERKKSPFYCVPATQTIGTRVIIISILLLLF